MRSRLLVSAAILVAGFAVEGLAVEGLGVWRSGVASAQGVLDNARRNPHAPAKRYGEPGRASVRPGGSPRARGEFLPQVKHNNDASVVPPRGLSGRGERDRRDGMAGDRSSPNRAIAQGRLRPELDRAGDGYRNENRRGVTRPGRRPPASAIPNERGEPDLARIRTPRRLPDQAMGGASTRELGRARSQAGSQMSGRVGSKAGGQVRSQVRSQVHSQARGQAGSLDRTALQPERHRGGRDDISKAQAALNQQGFNIGDADGKLGKRTREALIAFQKQRGFPATGKVDRATLQALLAGGAAPGGHQDHGDQQRPATPAQAEPPQGVPVPPGTTGQGSTGQGDALPPPAGALPQPAERETPPALDGLEVPDTGARGRVPAGAPQDDYKDDTLAPGGDQR
jgi:hypothetical protein